MDGIDYGRLFSSIAQLRALRMRQDDLLQRLVFSLWRKAQGELEGEDDPLKPYIDDPISLRSRLRRHNAEGRCLIVYKSKLYFVGYLEALD